MKVLKGISFIILFSICILGLIQVVEAKKEAAGQVEGRETFQDQLVSFDGWQLVNSNCDLKYQQGINWLSDSTKFSISPLGVAFNKYRNMYIYTSPICNSALESKKTYNGFILRVHFKAEELNNPKKINFSNAKLNSPKSGSKLNVITQPENVRLGGGELTTPPWWETKNSQWGFLLFPQIPNSPRPAFKPCG